MRTGLLSRCLLLVLIGAGVFTAACGFLGLASEQVPEPNSRMQLVYLAMALSGVLATVLCLLGYLILAELQAQTALVGGPGNASGGSSLKPPSQKRSTEPTRPVGNELRIGRGDAWS